jgi:hypothetical protein
MVVLLEGSPISTFMELCQSDHWVIGHLHDQGPSPPIVQFGWATSSRKSVVGNKLVPFKNDEGHCVLGDLQCCRRFWYPSPDLCLNSILSRSSTDNSFDLVAWCAALWDSCKWPDVIQPGIEPGSVVTPLTL